MAAHGCPNLFLEIYIPIEWIDFLVKHTLPSKLRLLTGAIFSKFVLKLNTDSAGWVQRIQLITADVGIVYYNKKTNKQGNKKGNS